MGSCSGKKAPAEKVIPPTNPTTVTRVVEETAKETPAPEVSVEKDVKVEILEPEKTEPPIPDHLPEDVKEAARDQWNKDKSVVALADTVYSKVRDSLVEDVVSVDTPPHNEEPKVDDSEEHTRPDHSILQSISIPKLEYLQNGEIEAEMSNEGMVELQSKTIKPEESGGCLMLCTAANA